NRSFWMHVDAAWGGYVASLFRGHSLSRKSAKQPLDEIVSEYVQSIAAREDFTHTITHPNVSSKKLRALWFDRDVYSAYLALEDADSIVVDPHKMGYVPYPAGIVAFGNGLVTELILQK